VNGAIPQTYPWGYSPNGQAVVAISMPSDTSATSPQNLTIHLFKRPPKWPRGICRTPLLGRKWIGAG
jgi:hypothetical protein